MNLYSNKLFVYSLFPTTIFACAAAMAHDQPEQSIERIVIESRPNMFGNALSASQGIVNQQEISARPLLRTAKVKDLNDLSTIANAFEVGINQGRDELVIDVKEVKQSALGVEQAIMLFGQDAWNRLDDAIVLVYC